MAGARISAPSSSRSCSELQIALALDDNDADVHRILAALNLNFNEHDKAVYHQERALSLNPNSDLIVVQQGEVLTWLGRPEEGIDGCAGRCGSTLIIRSVFGLISAGRNTAARAHADAIASFSKLTAPDHTHHAWLAAAAARARRPHRRGRARPRGHRAGAGIHRAGLSGTLHYRQPAEAERLREGLIKAGLPE